MKHWMKTALKLGSLVLFLLDGSVRAHSQISVQPFPLDQVELSESWVSNRDDLTLKYLKSLDPDRLLHTFRINAGIPSNAQPLNGWEAPNSGLRGHFVGHYLSAVSMMVHRKHDPEMEKRLNYLVAELEKCQLSLGDKGYLCAFPESAFDHIEHYFTGVWAPYYTYHKIMQGLLNAYLYTHNEQAYRMVLRMADYVELRMSKLDETSKKRMLLMVEANPQNEVGAMNEVFYGLYSTTKNPKYLTLAQTFEPAWFYKSLVENKDVLSGLHANTHLVLVDGFAKGYEQTKKDDYRKAVAQFWDMLLGSHAYVNGSSSGPRPNRTTPTSLTAEHWGLPGELAATMTGEIAESCVTHNTQKQSTSLFSWTGKEKYADAYLNTFYNGTMALQSAHSGRCVYHLPLGSPRHKRWLSEDDFRCCNGSTIEAFSSLNTGIYHHTENDVWVTMYIPSTLYWKEKSLSITQRGEFPSDSVVTFSVFPQAESTRFAMKLFVPSHVKNAWVSINHSRPRKAGPMRFITLDRTWKKGDEVSLTFDFDFSLTSMPDDKNVIAISYGPTLLAFTSEEEIVLKGSKTDILAGLRKSDNTDEFVLQNGNRTYRLIPLNRVENEAYSVYATINNAF